jgi:hypothetical protein
MLYRRGRHQTLDIAGTMVAGRERGKLVKAAGMTAGRRWGCWGCRGCWGWGDPSPLLLSMVPRWQPFVLVEAAGVEDKALENGRGKRQEEATGKRIR